MGKVFKQAVKVTNRLLPQIKQGMEQEANQSSSKIQKDVKDEKQKAKPLTAKRGTSVGEMASPEASAAKRRGRRSNIMGSPRGVTGMTETRKKTLLGG